MFCFHSDQEVQISATRCSQQERGSAGIGAVIARERLCYLAVGQARAWSPEKQTSALIREEQFQSWVQQQQAWKRTSGSHVIHSAARRICCSHVIPDIPAQAAFNLQWGTTLRDWSRRFFFLVLIFHPNLPWIKLALLFFVLSTRSRAKKWVLFPLALLRAEGNSLIFPRQDSPWWFCLGSQSVFLYILFLFRLAPVPCFA